MAQAYDYMNDIGPAGAGLAQATCACAPRPSPSPGAGLRQFAGIAAGAPGRGLHPGHAAARRARAAPREEKLGLAAAYFALPIDGALGVVDDVYVGSSRWRSRSAT